MAFVQKTDFGSKPAVERHVDFRTIKRSVARFLPLIVSTSIALALLRIFATAHPMLAIWIASALFGWLFLYGASRAASSD